MTPDQIAAARARADAATPWPRLERYEHGGGRAWIEEDNGRKLVADYYHAEDREFYHAARTDVPALCDALESAMGERDRLLEAMHKARASLLWLETKLDAYGGAPALIAIEAGATKKSIDEALREIGGE